MAEDYLRSSIEGTTITVRVSPGAKRSSIEGSYGEAALKVRVAAPPVDGRANAEVERFLSEVLGLARNDIELIRGHTGRDKIVLLRGVEAEGVRSALAMA